MSLTGANTAGQKVTLALDTATEHLALGLEARGVVLASAVHLGRAHAERIANEVSAFFASSGLAFRAERIVLGLGPGSYTGLRVGASYAHGLARAWNANLVGVSTLEGLACTLEGTVAPLLDARRGNVYGGIYRVEGGLIAQVLLEESKLERAAFLELAEEKGAHLLEGAAPSGLGLIRAARTRGQKNASLRYL